MLPDGSFILIRVKAFYLPIDIRTVQRLPKDLPSFARMGTDAATSFRNFFSFPLSHRGDHRMRKKPQPAGDEVSMDS